MSIVRRLPLGVSKDGTCVVEACAGATTPHLRGMFGYAMVSLNFKLAVLNALAQWPERRITLDELRQEIETVVVNEDPTEQLKRFAAVGDIDIFQSGLVERDDDGFQITESGLSLLYSLESPSGSSSEDSAEPSPQKFRLIDDLVGKKERLKIFNLELRTLESGAGEGGDGEPQQEEISAVAATPDPPLETSAADRLEPEIDTRTAVSTNEAPSRDAPAFLRRGFGSKEQDPNQTSSRLTSLFASIVAKTRSTLNLWRQHSAPALSNPAGHPVGKAGGVALALLSLMVVVIGVAAAIALGRIKSLKSEIAMLHRELLPLRERLAKLERVEARDPDHPETAQQKPVADKNKPADESSTEQAGFSLSREEIDLIRNYIKPAPSAGPAAPAINVGDPVGSATIPLPSPLVEKIPKLLGARFTTRNGAIIIVKRNSRQADAVLFPQ